MRIRLRMFRAALSVSKSESYYPECKRKSLIIRIFENIFWVFKYKEDNRFYNLYGLDLKRSRHIFSSNYIDYDMNFRIPRDKKNKLNNPNSQIYLLRDKFQFWKYLDSNNIPTPKVFAIIIDGKIYDSKLSEKNLEWLQSFNDFFIKDNNGECASFVKYISSGKKINEDDSFLSNKSGQFICQERITQINEISNIYSGSINTVRIVTVRKGNDIKVLSAILRIGTSNSKQVDNWAKGGIAVGISKDGHLNKYGFFKPHLGTKTCVHPDTGVLFEGLLIPNFESIIKTVINAHEKFYGIHSIGWDVCVGEKGPILIEGNDNWEISLMQGPNGGLKKEWLDLLQ